MFQNFTCEVKGYTVYVKINIISHVTLFYSMLTAVYSPNFWLVNSECIYNIILG